MAQPMFVGQAELPVFCYHKWPIAMAWWLALLAPGKP